MSFILDRESGRLQRSHALNAMVLSASIAGTHVSNPVELPEDLVADLRRSLEDPDAVGLGEGQALDRARRVRFSRLADARIVLFLASEIGRRGPTRRLRYRAGRAVPSLLFASAHAAVRTGLEDGSALVREDAVRAVSRLRLVDLLPSVVERLESDSAHEVRRSAAVTLGELGQRDSVEVLLRALDRPQERLSVTLSIRSALGRLTGMDHGTSAEDWRKGLRRPGSGAPPAPPERPSPIPVQPMS